MRVNKIDFIFLNIFFNLLYGAPICPSLAMHHAYTQAAAARTLVTIASTVSSFEAMGATLIQSVAIGARVAYSQPVWFDRRLT